MAYERYTRGGDSAGDFGQDYGSGRDYSYSSARDYAAAGQDGPRGRGRGGYGRDDHRDYGSRDYGSRDYGAGGFGGEGSGSYGGGRYRDRESSQPYRGSYASDGHRFADVDQDERSSWERDNRYSGERGSSGRYLSDRDDRFGSRHRDWGARSGNEARGYEGRGYGGRGYGEPDARGYGDRNRSDRDHPRFRGQPQGYDYDDRGFLERAGDEVRSWFGDEDAERRREMDQRYDERQERRDDRYGDSHYGSWRNAQLAEFDRDYDEYRQENASKFHNEFSNWRTERQGQRTALNRVEEHMEVVGSDGQHVGTVDKVRGDRIVLTKSDADAHGHHHSIPSRWIDSVDSKVKIRKSADEAKRHWRDEERNEAMFGGTGSSRDPRNPTDSPATTGQGNLGTIGGTANTGGTSETGTTAGTTATGGTSTQGGSSIR